MTLPITDREEGCRSANAPPGAMAEGERSSGGTMEARHRPNPALISHWPKCEIRHAAMNALFDLEGALAWLWITQRDNPEAFEDQGLKEKWDRMKDRVSGLDERWGGNDAP